MVVWDLTGILSHPRSILVGEEHEVWLAPGSLSDNLPSNLVDALPDVVGDTLTLYVGVWRYGLVMLDFQPDAVPGSRLVHVKTVHTPGMTSGLSFREIGGERQLIVSDTIGGLRIFRQAEELGSWVQPSAHRGRWPSRPLCPCRPGQPPRSCSGPWMGRLSSA